MQCELIDHGIDHAQYFPGCGVAFSKFEHCMTGSGSNFSEAVADALDQIACSHYGSVADAIEKKLTQEYGNLGDTLSPNTDAYHEENEDSEMYYYVSIRWK